MVANLIRERLRISRLHWGGRTPSILGLDGLRSVLAALFGSFARDASFEQVIELDPRHVTSELAEGFTELEACQPRRPGRQSADSGSDWPDPASCRDVRLFVACHP